MRFLQTLHQANPGVCMRRLLDNTHTHTHTPPCTATKPNLSWWCTSPLRSPSLLHWAHLYNPQLSMGTPSQPSLGHRPPYHNQVWTTPPTRACTKILLSVAGPGGAGYSDSHVARDPLLGPPHQKRCARPADRDGV